MKQVHQFARKHLKVSSDWQKNYNHHPCNQYWYKRGNPVWLYSPQRKKDICLKLMRSFDGHTWSSKEYTLSDLVYRIQKGQGFKPKVVHHDQLKRYCRPNTPDWRANSDEHKQPGHPIAPQEPVQANNPVPEPPTVHCGGPCGQEHTKHCAGFCPCCER